MRRLVALLAFAVVAVALGLSCTKSNPAQADPQGQTDLGRLRDQVEQLTKKVEKLEKQSNEWDLQITALKTESESLDKQVGHLADILKQWSNNLSDKEVIQDKLVAAGCKLAFVQVKEFIEARKKFRAEVDKVWKEFESKKAK